MDGDQFDQLSRWLGRGIPRRAVVVALAALAVGGIGEAAAKAKHKPHRRATDGKGGNRDCAHFCTTVFPPGPQRGQCISDAAHGTGACLTCHADPTTCVPCQTSADCPTGLVCDASAHVCRSCASGNECAPLDQFGSRYCVALADGSGQARCTNPNECGCPGTCADCGGGSLCIYTGGGVCEGKNLCCPPKPAL